VRKGAVLTIGPGDDSWQAILIGVKESLMEFDQKGQLRAKRND
jgi:hypothetical protein